VTLLQRLASAPTPVVSGTARVGGVLAVAPGAWGPAPVDLAYQWLRSGAVIPGATGATYTVTADDAGRLLSVRVTGSKAGRADATRTSAATAVR
jgi:hypothetical protein